MKEQIEILDKNGNKKIAEVIFRFRDEQNNTFYIVYKHNDEFFAAKYDDVVGTSKLDTNLTEKEFKVLEKFLNQMPEV